MKDRKAFCTDLKNVYGATNREVAEQELEKFDTAWGGKYRHTTLFYIQPVRRARYPTPTIPHKRKELSRSAPTPAILFPDGMPLAISVIYRTKAWNFVLKL